MTPAKVEAMLLDQSASLAEVNVEVENLHDGLVDLVQVNRVTTEKHDTLLREHSDEHHRLSERISILNERRSYAVLNPCPCNAVKSERTWERWVGRGIY